MIALQLDLKLHPEFQIHANPVKSVPTLNNNLSALIAHVYHLFGEKQPEKYKHEGIDLAFDTLSRMFL